MEIDETVLNFSPELDLLIIAYRPSSPEIVALVASIQSLSPSIRYSVALNSPILETQKLLAPLFKNAFIVQRNTDNIGYGRAANNLFLENIAKNKIIIIGNTVIDSLYQVIDSGKAIIPSDQKNFIGNSPLVFVTAHRRESWGEGIESISLGINSAAINNPEAKFIVCLHPNPLPRQMLEKNLKGLSNVMVVEPQPYSVICGLLNRSIIVVTDSGGIQEEAISLGKPVLITRENTERIEGIKLGLAKIVGTNSSLLNEEINKLISETSFNLERLTDSPYGDGKAGIRGAQAIEFIKGFGSAPKPWTYIETNFISKPKGI
jgi:UDP-N-acetylglucosamine 2-epimerase (non-hydrolysing)